MNLRQKDAKLAFTTGVLICAFWPLEAVLRFTPTRSKRALAPGVHCSAIFETATPETTQFLSFQYSKEGLSR